MAPNFPELLGTILWEISLEGFKGTSFFQLYPFDICNNSRKEMESRTPGDLSSASWRKQFNGWGSCTQQNEALVSSTHYWGQAALFPERNNHGWPKSGTQIMLRNQRRKSWSHLPSVHWLVSHDALCDLYDFGSVIYVNSAIVANKP